MASPIVDSPEGGLRLSTAGQTILSAVTDAAATLLYDLPGKQYVTTGAAVFDCEQVAVSLLNVRSGIGLGQGSELVQGGPGCDIGWTLIAEVAIVRCGPTPNVKGTISADKLNAGTTQSSKDLFVLLEAIENLASSSFGGFSASLVPEDIQGGFVSVSATITTVF